MQRKYQAIENKLLKHIQLLEERYWRDKCGTSGGILKQKCMLWVEYAKIIGFKCSDGWFNGALTQHGLKIFNIHGEEDYLIDEQIAQVIFPRVED